MTKQYYLRDTRSNVGSNATFWAEKGGYTTNLKAAEIFTEEEALRQHNSRETDLPVPVDFITGKTRQRVDCQNIDWSPTLRDAEKHVVIIGGQWDGNDVLFVGDKCSTFELVEAKLFELEDGCVLAAKNCNYSIHPYDDMAAIARTTIDAKHVDPKSCADFAGLTLNEPQGEAHPFFTGFYGGHATYAPTVPDKLAKVKTFTLEQCQAALKLPHLQSTVVAAVQARIRKLQKEQAA